MAEIAESSSADRVAAIRQECLDDILSRWDHWLHPIKVGYGFSASAAGCSLYRPSRQYDDANGALDDAVEHRVMQGVQACVDRLETTHRTAIYIEARNARTGSAVWRSPRMPADQILARALIAAARLRLIELLVDAAILE